MMAGWKHAYPPGFFFSQTAHLFLESALVQWAQLQARYASTRPLPAIKKFLLTPPIPDRL